jgi:Fe-S-cluster containining protein
MEDGWGGVRAEYDGLPCVAHSCSRCCTEAEMPLLESDAARLEALGHRREEFSVVDDEHVLQLRMVGGACYFFRAGRCSVHEVRPQACRLYPLVWDRDEGRVVRDTEWCPWARDFPPDPAGEQGVLRVLSVLRREAAARALPGEGAGKP